MPFTWGRPRVEHIPPDDGSGQPQQQQPRRRQQRKRGQRKLTTRSVITPKSLAAIQLMVSTADGAVTGPARREGQGKLGAFVQGMVTGTERAHIAVVALRRDENDTVVTVSINTSKGNKVNEITSDVVLWKGNVEATAKTIAETLLRIPNDRAMCQRELTALVAADVGSVRVFKIGAGNRLAISNREE